MTSFTVLYLWVNQGTASKKRWHWIRQCRFYTATITKIFSQHKRGSLLRILLVQSDLTSYLLLLRKTEKKNNPCAALAICWFLRPISGHLVRTSWDYSNHYQYMCKHAAKRTLKRCTPTLQYFTPVIAPDEVYYPQNRAPTRLWAKLHCV